MAIVRTRAEPQDEGEKKKKMKATPAFLGSLARSEQRNPLEKRKGTERKNKANPKQRADPKPVLVILLLPLVALVHQTPPFSLSVSG
jgi:hypothetical protein